MFRGSLLSIPLWSDFIIRGIENVEIFTKHFQSHYGLILSVTGQNRIITTHLNFQSHYGLILSDTIVCAPVISKLFQSHYGLILS